MKYLLTLFFIFILFSASSQNQCNNKNKSFFSSIFNRKNKGNVDNGPCLELSSEYKKVSRGIRKKHYAIQTKEVRKRMKKSRRKADNFNKRRVPLMEKIKKKFHG